MLFNTPSCFSIKFITHFCLSSLILKSNVCDCYIFKQFLAITRTVSYKDEKNYLFKCLLPKVVKRFFLMKAVGNVSSNYLQFVWTEILGGANIFRY